MALYHAQAGEVVRLLAPAGGKAGTAALVKTSRFEAIRLVVAAGETIPEHQLAGHVMLQCLEGHVSLAPVDAELRQGEWVYLEPATPYSFRGIASSVLLFTILFEDQTRPG